MVETDGTESFIPWNDVLIIMAVLVEHQARKIMMLTFETRDERVLMLAEIDAAWTTATDALHHHLPSAFPFAVWGAALLGGAGFTEVYEASCL